MPPRRPDGTHSSFALEEKKNRAAFAALLSRATPIRGNPRVSDLGSA
jgi:hypothetical protein